jgi:hypothetical protein
MCIVVIELKRELFLSDVAIIALVFLFVEGLLLLPRQRFSIVDLPEN